MRPPHAVLITIYWNLAWPVRLPLPINPCVNVSANPFGGFGLTVGLPAWTVTVCAASRSGAGQDLGPCRLDAQGNQGRPGWRKVMAYTGFLGEASGTLCRIRYGGMVTAGPAPALTSVMTPAATAARMMWMASVVLAGDALELLHVDGVGNTDGRPSSAP